MKSGLQKGFVKWISVIRLEIFPEVEHFLIGMILVRILNVTIVHLFMSADLKTKVQLKCSR